MNRDDWETQFFGTLLALLGGDMTVTAAGMVFGPWLVRIMPPKRGEEQRINILAIEANTTTQGASAIGGTPFAAALDDDPQTVGEDVASWLRSR